MRKYSRNAKYYAEIQISLELIALSRNYHESNTKESDSDITKDSIFSTLISLANSITSNSKSKVKKLLVRKFANILCQNNALIKLISMASSREKLNVETMRNGFRKLL